MDAMVLKTQQWLNTTYGNDARYIIVDEDGITGWSTIYAMRRALQIELGITSTSNNFGPTTTSRFSSRFPNGVQQQSSDQDPEDNIYGIIQGSLWCKGYTTSSSTITKHFLGGTGSAVTELKTDMGFNNPTSTVTTNVMKSLLSMDQFVSISSGNATIRSIQQLLNRGYEAYIGIIPCDGIYSRSMNTALIKVLQAIEGQTAAQADGIVGATTKSLCPILPDTGNLLTVSKRESATLLVRYSLCCNGYYIDITSNNWDVNLSSVISDFQGDMALQITGTANLDTWMALLLSCGNTSRSVTACDTRFEMTLDRINQLKSLGYQIVGRYLNGTDFKVLRSDEPMRIISNNMKFFPIYQESATSASYFTPSKGQADALSAVRAARKFKIPEGNVIFFAVDFDALDPEITTYILPYFSAIKTYCDTAYVIGIYGTRNVCSKVMDAGYAETCFVSDMSTGYSGNMGFKMPTNWTYDQFIETSLSPSWGIDKDAYSGAYDPIDALETYVYNKPAKAASSSNVSIISNAFLQKITELEALYAQYHFIATNIVPAAQQIALGTLNYLRSQKYAGGKWDLASCAANLLFVDYVNINAPDVHSYFLPYITANDDLAFELTDGGIGTLDLAHLAYTTEAYSVGSLAPDYWTGWGGDLATGMKETQALLNNDPTADAQILADSLIGAYPAAFNYSDICIDADANGLSTLITNVEMSERNPLSLAFDSYYNNIGNRYERYIDELECLKTLTSIRDAITLKLTGVLDAICLLFYLGDSPSITVRDACINSFAQYIYSELG